MTNVISKAMKAMRLQHEFCEFVPGNLKPGTLYISMESGTALHLCVCGCGQKVVTPFSPTDWKLIYDGNTVSLDPSIGNWSFDCKSHYWIKKNRVIVSEKWTYVEIEENRKYDQEVKADYFSNSKMPSPKRESGFSDFIKKLFGKN